MKNMREYINKNELLEWVEEQKRLIEESSANDVRKGASIVILDNLMKDFLL